MILMIALVLTISFAVTSDSAGVTQAIGVIGASFVILCEPVMIWTKGSTLGHMLCNLRVVDNRTFRSPSLPKAIIRFAIKALLGWFSYISIMLSRRESTVHDLLTGTTVQIRTIKATRSCDFTHETSEPFKRRLLSFFKRICAMIAYFILSLLVILLALILFGALGLFSYSCILYDDCKNAGKILLFFLGCIYLACLFAITYFGLLGQLFGFRAR